MLSSHISAATVSAVAAAAAAAAADSVSKYLEISFEQLLFKTLSCHLCQRCYVLWSFCTYNREDIIVKILNEYTLHLCLE